MAYDTARGRTVLFGGNSVQTLFGDTWQWDGEDWTQVGDSGPSARVGHAIAFDSERSVLVLFGGRSSGDALSSDTWQWDGEGWTQVADTGPSARAGHQLAFDGQRSRVVLFGGTAADAVHGETWEWDGQAWTQHEDIGPSARSDHAMAFDASRSRVVLFGGNVGGTAAGDTWEWDGASWTQLADFGPSACAAAAMTFAGNAMLLFGGIDSLATTNTSPRLFGLTWEWDGQHWTQRQDIGPAARWGHALAFASDRGQVVLFGGAAVGPGDQAVRDHLLGDTWEAAGAAAPADTPPELASFTLNPATVHGGEGTAAAVGLSKPAAREAKVAIVSGETTLASIAIPTGESAGSAPVAVAPIGSPETSFLLEARLGQSKLSATVHVLPPTATKLVSLSLNPATVTVDQPATTAEVALDAPAAAPTTVQITVPGGNFTIDAIVPTGSTTGRVSIPFTRGDLSPGDIFLDAHLGDTKIPAQLHVTQ
jgi:hypothetical protein